MLGGSQLPSKPDDHHFIARTRAFLPLQGGFGRPSFRDFRKDPEHEYHVEVIDTWNMTIVSAGIHRGVTRVDLPGKQYMAIRIKSIK